MIILLAYDASEQGRDHLLRSPELNWLPHDDVHLLAALPMPTGLFLGEGYVPGEILDEERAEAQRVLDAGAQTLAERGFRCVAHLSFGEPVDDICKLARTMSANLVLVRHPERLSFTERWWRGWLGSSLLEHSPCSVLISVLN